MTISRTIRRRAVTTGASLAIAALVLTACASKTGEGGGGKAAAPAAWEQTD